MALMQPGNIFTSSHFYTRRSEIPDRRFLPSCYIVTHMKFSGFGIGSDDPPRLITELVYTTIPAT